MKKFTIEFTWAIIYTLASLLWTVLEKALGFHDKYIGSEMIFVWVFGLVAIPIYFFALRDKKKNFYNGQATWTQLFLSGLVMSVFVALMSPLAQYISWNLISPDFIANSIDHYVRIKKMSPENAAMLFSYRGLILQGISNGISVGVLISALIALFIKTDAAAIEPAPIVKTKSKAKRK
ncbi:MAG: DUF4199 domain-containing protein [Flavobacterium sp.]|nr:MAG: DUF4199 domain-containing protein [Flavobacterium sp.]